MLAHLAHADKAFTDASINCALMEEWICFYSLPFLPRVRLASDVKVGSPSDLQTCFLKNCWSPVHGWWHPQDQDEADRSQEAQLSLPRKRVCDLTNSLWKNWARLSTFRILVPIWKSNHSFWPAQTAAWSPGDPEQGTHLPEKQLLCLNQHQD